MNETRRHVLRCNGVEIDPALGLVRRDGEEIYLRSKTHQFLLYLIEHRDGPVPKEELLRNVWEGASVADTTLFGCVKELRKALGDDARDPQFIRTMSKKGYWFVAPVEEEGSQEPLLDTAGEVEASLSKPPLLPPPADPPTSGSGIARWLLAALATLVTLTAVVVLARSDREPEAHYTEIAWWKLDEGPGLVVSDSLSNMRGPVSPGVRFVAGVPGIPGSALNFEGNDVLVRGDDPSILPRGDKARTLTAWVQTTSTNADSTVIFRYGDPSGVPKSDAFHLLLHGTGRAGFGNGILEPLKGMRIDDGKWHHLAGVFEGSPTREARLYVDGQEQSHHTIPLDSLQAGDRSEWVIGRAPWGGTTFRGVVDDVRVFDRALNAHEVRALQRCGSGVVDLKIEGKGDYFFGPIFSADAEVRPASGDASSRVINGGRDNAGITFVKREPGCGMKSIGAADLGQDLHISMDLRVGGSSTLLAEGGPYFRSRRSAPGDGVIGGTSAGYWVQLQSDGQVRVKRLHPQATVAFTPVQPTFDAGAFHHLEVKAKGQWLQVWLDGNELVFDVAGQRMSRVPIPPAWNAAKPKGNDRGTAGIGFACYRNRSQIGGQEARNIRVQSLP